MATGPLAAAEISAGCEQTTGQVRDTGLENRRQAFLLVSAPAKT
jgi:hypothetical protein